MNCTVCPSGFNKVFVKYDATCRYQREILFKPNESRRADPSKPHGRTLFLFKVPPYCRDKSMRKIFGKFGPIESICYESSLSGSQDDTASAVIQTFTAEDLKYFPKEKLQVEGYGYAYIVFEDPESIKKAMNQKVNPTATLLSKYEDVGMKKWIREFKAQYPDKDKLKDNIDSFMHKYDIAMKRIEEDEKLAGEEDQDGWIKVTKGGKTPCVSRTEANQLIAKQKQKNKNKRKDLLNSYSYQIRESKRQKIFELRQKFEEDKQRVQEMVDARKFKPF